MPTKEITAHANVYVALAAAQMEMGKATKNAENPHFRSRYADLASVMAAALPALNAHGIALVQPVIESEFGRHLRTMFVHGASDTNVWCDIPLIVSKSDMHGFGSALTYARRYGLLALAGLAPEDDDGNAAVAAAQETAPKSWVQTIIAELPPAATGREKAEAVVDALESEFERAKTPESLAKAWDRRVKEISALAKYSDLHDRVVDGYENRVIEITPKTEEDKA